MGEGNIRTLFDQPILAVNVGLTAFAENLRAQGADVEDVDWRPPLGDYAELTTVGGVDVDAANAEVLRRLNAGHPRLVGLGLARDTVPGLRDKLLLHAGPPTQSGLGLVTWDRMCGPLRGAVIGAILY